MEQDQVLNLILDKVEGMDKKLDSIDSRLGSVESRLDNVESRLDNVEHRLDNVETRLDNMDDRLTKLEVGQKELNEKVDKLPDETEMISRTVSKLEYNFEHHTHEIGKAKVVD